MWWVLEEKMQNEGLCCGLETTLHDFYATQHRAGIPAARYCHCTEQGVPICKLDHVTYMRLSQVWHSGKNISLSLRLSVALSLSFTLRRERNRGCIVLCVSVSHLLPPILFRRVTQTLCLPAAHWWVTRLHAALFLSALVLSYFGFLGLAARMEMHTPLTFFASLFIKCA